MPRKDGGQEAEVDDADEESGPHNEKNDVTEEEKTSSVPFNISQFD